MKSAISNWEDPESALGIRGFVLHFGKKYYDRLKEGREINVSEGIWHCV